MTVSASVAHAAVATLVCGSILLACGAEVDLGGASGDGWVPPLDGGDVAVTSPADADAPRGQCAPCLDDSDCASGVCAKFADDLFCTSACSAAAPCASDQTCSQLLSPTGTTISACLPNDTKCAPDNGPIGPDGAPLEHCNTDLDGPGVTSTCKACGSDTADCQPNGCYGGYWCDSDKMDCVMPPKTCK
jgi:hypothetical protein